VSEFETMAGRARHCQARSESDFVQGHHTEPASSVGRKRCDLPCCERSRWAEWWHGDSAQSCGTAKGHTAPAPTIRTRCSGDEPQV